MSLPDILRDLAAKHSYMKVHTELMHLMKEEYATLKAFFDGEAPKKRRAPTVAQTPSVSTATEQPPITVPAEEEIPAKVLANTKIRIIKKAANPDSALKGQEQEQGQTPVASKEQKPRMESKELKAWQKQQEAKKLAELTAAGVDPESLLTAESIKRWVEEEGRTFAYVAREYVGLPEATVADFAKDHGVKSKISKSRAILSAKNRRP